MSGQSPESSSVPVRQSGSGSAPSPSGSPVLSMSGWAAPVAWAGFGVLVFPAVAAHLKRPRHRFTTVTCFAVIGVLGGLLQAVASNWTYTSLLSGWAEQAFGSASARSPTVAAVCTLSLLAGGTAMAIRLRRFRLGRPAAWRCCATVCGGALMGFAAMMIPGGNDALLLSGLPSLSRNALAAYVAMLGALAILLSIRQAWFRPPAPPAGGKAN
jgi:Sulphur transport